MANDISEKLVRFFSSMFHCNLGIHSSVSVLIYHDSLLNFSHINLTTGVSEGPLSSQIRVISLSKTLGFLELFLQDILQ